MAPEQRPWYRRPWRGRASETSFFHAEIDMTRRFEPKTTALLICDLQNDYVHPDGAYARGGAANETITAVPARVKVAADAVRAAGGWIVATKFTLVPGKGGEPLISSQLKRLRPFLRKGDFAP